MEAIKLEPAELGTVFVINKILATYEEINGSVIDDEEEEAERITIDLSQDRSRTRRNRQLVGF